MVSEYPRGENNDCWQLQPRELKETLADYSNSAGCSQRFLATARLQAKTNACWPLEFRGLKHHLVVIEPQKLKPTTAGHCKPTIAGYGKPAS